MRAENHPVKFPIVESYNKAHLNVKSLFLNKYPHNFCLAALRSIRLTKKRLSTKVNQPSSGKRLNTFRFTSSRVTIRAGILQAHQDIYHYLSWDLFEDLSHVYTGWRKVPINWAVVSCQLSQQGSFLKDFRGDVLPV